MSIINTPRLDRLWQEAQIHAEWATTRLWEYIFNHIVFKDEKWVVSSQQPATHQEGELRRVDLVVEKMNSDATKVETVLFIEAKRATASTADIEEAEHQAFTAVCAYCIDTQVKYVWAMTCIGSAARLWAFKDGHLYLTPFVPEGEGLSDKSEYLEIVINGQTIMAGLEYIKRHTTPPASLFPKARSPEPPNQMFPQDLGSTEAMQLDEYDGRDYEPNPNLGGTSGMSFGETSDPSAYGRTQPLGVVQEPDFAWPEEEGFTAPMNQEETEEISHNDQQQEERSRYIEVKVTRVKHTLSSDEFIFRNRKRQQVKTNKNDWTAETQEGRTVWVYKHGKKSIYWTKRLD
ncbi:hypothetical protein CEP54_013127 [Fusarium duplospermum]|uniref:Uncharacterized protein n=1 Tax=Fusarium duplospermum TaxID=1325734 RepID=A0A428P4U7_9HYPO|nr:hypothetical protein CEP54_013127 [Fusarium duplospermum]